MENENIIGFMRKTCEDNGVPFQETVQTITQSQIARNDRYNFVKEMKHQGNDFYYYEIQKPIKDLKTVVESFFKKYFKSDYVAKLRKILLLNKNKLYFIIEKNSDSELLLGDMMFEYEQFSKIEDRVKLCIQITNAVIEIRSKLKEKGQDPSLYGLSTQKFNYSISNKKVEFINIGLDEFLVATSDTNDRKFWPPEKFTLTMKNIDKYKLDIYSLGCIFFEIISGHFPLEEDSNAALDLIKNKAQKLVSEECEKMLIRELENFNKKDQLIKLIDDMTTLEVSNRNIKFEEVQNILNSLLPDYQKKIQCKNCLDRAEIFINISGGNCLGRYCETCRKNNSGDDFLLNNEKNVTIESMIKTKLPEILQKETKDLHNIRKENQLNNFIDEIKQKEKSLNEMKTQIDSINQNFEDIILQLNTV